MFEIITTIFDTIYNRIVSCFNPKKEYSDVKYQKLSSHEETITLNKIKIEIPKYTFVFLNNDENDN